MNDLTSKLEVTKTAEESATLLNQALKVDVKRFRERSEELQKELDTLQEQKDGQDLTIAKL